MTLFNSLPDALLARLFAKARSRKIAAKHDLFAAGDSGSECFRVEKGLLKIHVVSVDGAERTLSIVGAGSVLGELSLLDGRPRSALVTALTDCELKYISRAEFERFAAQTPEVYEHLTKLLTGLVRETDASLAVSSFLSREGRLAWAILKLASEFGSKDGSQRIVIRQKLSQGDIGGLADVSRENASRILNKWMRLGVLSRSNGFYALHDKVKLEKIARF